MRIGLAAVVTAWAAACTGAGGTGPRLEVSPEVLAPNVQIVRVEGHADACETDPDRSMSQRRAFAVGETTRHGSPRD